MKFEKEEEEIVNKMMMIIIMMMIMFRIKKIEKKGIAEFKLTIE